MFLIGFFSIYVVFGMALLISFLFTNDEITKKINYYIGKIGIGVAVGAVFFLFVIVAIMIIREE